MYNAATDTLHTQTHYWYNEQGEYQGVKIDSTYYYTSTYDQENRIIGQQQIYESKLRWEWTYTYSEHQRIGHFQTYYRDGDNHSKQEIKPYNKEGLLIEIEELQVPKGGLQEKTKLYYDEQGVIQKIEYYQSFDNEDYQLIAYSDIQLKSILSIDASMAEKINKTIYAQ